MILPLVGSLSLAAYDWPTSFEEGASMMNVDLKKLKLGVGFTKKSLDFDLYKVDEESQELEDGRLRPNGGLFLGFDFDYDSFGLSMVLPTGGYREESLYGKTQFIDYKISHFQENLGGSLQYQRYDGFYFEDDSEEVLKRPDILHEKTGLELYISSDFINSLAPHILENNVGQFSGAISISKNHQFGVFGFLGYHLISLKGGAPLVNGVLSFEQVGDSEYSLEQVHGMRVHSLEYGPALNYIYQKGKWEARGILSIAFGAQYLSVDYGEKSERSWRQAQNQLAMSIESYFKLSDLEKVGFLIESSRQQILLNKLKVGSSTLGFTANYSRQF